MPVLLLAQGNQESKQLLRRAIEARYGLGPPALETLTFRFQGRRAGMGFFQRAASIEGQAVFKFPQFVRWDYTARLFGLIPRRSKGVFNGITYQGEEAIPEISDSDAEAAEVARACLWAMSAVFLTPLTEEAVKLDMPDEFRLDATHTVMGTTAQLQFDENYLLQSVETQYTNPKSKRSSMFAIRLPQGQTLLDDLMLPRKLVLLWDDQTDYDVTLLTGTINEPYDDDFFNYEN